MEVAGLVLGAIPLMITALEKYQEAGKLYRTFKQVDRIYKRILRDLENERQTLRLRLRELLIPLVESGVLEDDELDDFIAVPGGPAWNVSDATAALQSRLGPKYTMYIDTIDQFWEATFALMKILDRDDRLKLQAVSSQKVAWESGRNKTDAGLMSRANLCFQAQGVKLAFQKKNAAELLRQMNECNLRLDQMLRDVDREAYLARRVDSARSRRTVLGVVAHYWMHADRIYRLLTASWQCTCVNLHVGHLWLQKRRSIELSLRLLYDEGNHPAVQPRWSHKTLEVSGPDAFPDSVAHSVVNPVPDLCKTLARAHQNGTSLGRMTMGAEPAKYSLAETAASVATSAARSLSDSMVSAQPPNRVQRCEIATIVASSYLQLSSTPWVGANFTAHQVMVPCNAQGHWQYEKPFLKAVFHDPSPGTTPAASQDSPFRDLAILLLELAFGRRVEDHPRWHLTSNCEPSARDVLVDGIVTDWARGVLEETCSMSYAKAVRWCLEQNGRVFSNEEWRTSFADSVLVELQRCFEAMSQK